MMTVSARTSKKKIPTCHFAFKLMFKFFRWALWGILSSYASLHAQSTGRVSDGLIAYYPFTDGNGFVVNDQSGFGEALDLNMTGGIVSWLDKRNGISIASGSIIQNSGPAAKLYAEILRSQAFTYEIWCKPVDTTQQGPARMMSYSIDTGSRNFMIGQEAESIIL